jgi:hypothetical protein
VKRRSLEDLHFYLDTQIEDVIIVMYVEDNIFEITPIEGVSCLSVLSVLPLGKELRHREITISKSDAS